MGEGKGVEVRVDLGYNWQGTDLNDRTQDKISFRIGVIYE
jgi:hypothetical protein